MSAVSRVVKANARNDDDIVDRLNHQFTVMFLIVFTIVVSTTQYVGKPIECWCPAYFTENHVDFTNKVCWVSNTYYVPEGAPVGSQSGSDKYHISYYQWVPLMLLIQAFMFYVPCLIWRVFSERSGININNLVEAADTIQNALYPERRDKTIKYMIRHLDHYLDYQREYRGGTCAPAKRFLARNLYILCGNRYGNYLITLYLTIKLTYLVNLLVQLFTLDAFLGAEYHLYGVTFLRDLANGTSPAATSRRFPRVTMCDFTIRQMGNIHPHTVQCVLPINLFNEKIYVFLWFWYTFVAVVTFSSFLRWLWIVGLRCNRIQYVRRHLKIMGKVEGDNDRDRKMSHKFAQMYLRQDGVFVLKLVAKNSTDLVVADIIGALWDNYKNKPLFGSRSSEDIDVDEIT